MTTAPHPLADRLDLVVAADPESCVQTARALARLGAVGDGAAGRLGVCGAEEDGLVGEADRTYRASLRELIRSADQLGRVAGALGAALGDFAGEMAEVRRLMDDARAHAAPWLPTSETEIRPPDRLPDATDPDLARRWSAWREAAACCAEARRRERAAEEQLTRALRSVGGDSPGPTKVAGPGAVAEPVRRRDVGGAWVRPAGAGDVTHEARFEHRPRRPDPPPPQPVAGDRGG